MSPIRSSKSISRFNPFFSALFQPVPILSLVLVRMAFGLLMAWRAVDLWLGGGADQLYLAQSIHFKYPLFGWVPDPSDTAFAGILGLVGLSAACIAIGLLYRVACAAFTLSWSYVFLFDQTAYQNHDYLICLLGFLFLLMPLNRHWAVDALIWPRIRSEFVPAWCLYLFRFQIGVVYFFGAVRKFNPDWLRGEPIRSMLHIRAFDHPSIGSWLFHEPLVMTFAYGGLALDLLIIPALLWRPTRLPAFLVLLGFHLANAVLWEIDVFPWFMIVATLLFFDPDSPRRVLRRIRRESATKPSPTPKAVRDAVSRRQKALGALLGVYTLAQVMVPLRPFLYPGHPLEQPDLLKFSWNMMLRLDSTQLIFLVVDHDSGEQWEIAAESLLSPFQMGRLGSPDMMHQLARHLAAEKEAAGRANVSVYMRAFQRVHARPWQVVYDPDTDFAATPRTLGVKPWLLPFVEPYPPDPAARNAYDRARWEFCKREGYLPLARFAGDPEVLEHLRIWDAEYRKSIAPPKVPE